MKKSLLVMLAALVLSSCSTIDRDEFATFRHQTAADIYHKARTALIRHHYSHAVTALEAMDAIYPFGVYAKQAQIAIIYAYHKKGDDASAVAAADRYIRLYPSAAHVDYALYMKGVISQTEGYSWMQKKLGVDPSRHDLKSQQRAFMAFHQLVSHYPRSPYSDDAMVRMRYLRNVFAMHEVNIARFYFKHKAYVAAANRAAEVVSHYNGTMAVKKAIKLMQQSYHRLELTKLEAKSKQLSASLES